MSTVALSRRAFVLTVLALALPSSATGQGTASEVSVKFRAAVVGTDLTTHAVPRLGLLIISPRGDTTRLSTDVYGVAVGRFATGVYRIESATPVEIGQARYRWAFFAIFANEMQPIELTQKNATIEPVAAPQVATSRGSPMGSSVAASTAPTVLDSAGGSAPVRADVRARVDLAAAATPKLASEVVTPPQRVNTEAQLFERYRSGVFTVFGSARGTGYLADSNGLVVTNAHLIEGSAEVRVQIDMATTVYARPLVVDGPRDLAVLAINMKRCGNCAVLPVLDTSKAPAPTEGERVVALGSPLNRVGALSIGIVNVADRQSIVSDASVNYLNTGGPLIDLDGNVIGLNSDKSERAGAPDALAPRLARSLAWPWIAAALVKARGALPALASRPVSDSLLPVAPREPFPVAPVRATGALAQMDLRNYRAAAGPFRILVMTPQVMAWREAQARKAAGERRRHGAGRGRAGDEIDPIQGWRDWDEYASGRRAVVIFNVTPEQTEFPFYESAKVPSFGAGNFEAMRIYRDGVEIIPVERVRVPAVLNGEEQQGADRAIPMQGIYVYRAEEFAPRVVGSTASYMVALVDATRPARTIQASLPSAMVEQIWRDFTPYWR